MMNFQTPVLFLLAAMLSPSAMAYEFEVGGAYRDSRFSSGPDSFRSRQEQDFREVGIEYFFGGIDDKVGPLAEAAFLAPASSVSIQVLVGNGENEAGSLTSVQTLSETDSEQFIASAKYFHEPSRWLFDVEYFSSGQDFRTMGFPALTNRGETDGVRVGLGRYLGESSFVGLHLRGARSTSNSGSAPSTFLPVSSDTDFWEVGLRAKTIFGAGQSIAYGLEGQAVGFRSQTTSSINNVSMDEPWSGRLSAIGSVYLGRERSITLRVDQTVGPLALQSTTASLSWRWFVRENVALGAGYSTVFFDESGDLSLDIDSDTFFLDVVWRFGGE
jgi:hypothetical protein